MQIFEVCENKKDYLELLLLADEQEDMIDRYLYRGKMFALYDDGLKTVCVVTDEGNRVLEIKNISTLPQAQKLGYGRKMINFIADRFKNDFDILQVGTGDSQATLPFYEKCGFVRSHLVKDFFTKNYDHPIIDGGVLLVDMVYLKKKI